MELTLNSSSSMIKRKDAKSSRNQENSSNMSFAKTKPPTYQFQAKSSVKEMTFTHEKTYKPESETTERWEKLHVLSYPHPKNDSSVPVFVMLPLDTVTMSGHLNKPRAMNASLMALKGAGVEGVMVDAWWGLVEKDGPMKYNWDGYAELIQMVQRHGLKLQVVMSFHQCGGNVGDSCSIPLPPWVLEEISKNPELVYTDKSGRRNPEYISLGCDSVPVLRGRTPIQVYSDFMRSFRERFDNYIGGVIAEIQVGMGPCGELRYPSYPESNGTWRFPGIGEFQCYDKYMKSSLQAYAESIGKTNWGTSGPHDAGEYKNLPEDTEFFRRDGTWNSEYGKFFMEWYSGKLLEHGDKLLSSAKAIFQGSGAKLSGKVAGIHWHYNTRSHAAELTAGYYNTRNHDGYLPIAKMFNKHGVVLNFTCMEMKDGEQPEHANCSPEGLVKQVQNATRQAGTELAGENALERYDSSAFGQVVATNRSDSGNGLTAFTYLRMNKRLFEGQNWQQLVEFVKNMKEGGHGRRLSEEDTTGSDLYVGFVGSKISETVEYPRSTPDMWEGLIQKAKDGGIDVIETYVFWNLHEPSPGKYDFDGRNDLVRFVKTIHKAGLYAHLRIGPYVCAEWNFGGFPVWLKYVPGISFRTDNEPFKRAMKGFTERIVELMKSEDLYESQGGPIILSQIENEYGRQGQLLGAEGHNYMTWAAKMAVATETGVPWVMCKEDDAPDPVINTCNGFYCDSFAPNKPYKPTIWTEAWSGWFTEFGGPMHHRPVQDLAFAVARFIQKGGSFVNYYMYHGGTNFGRTAGGPFVTTSYDYDAPIDEYGLIRQPKYGHLKELHKAIKMCGKTLVSTDPVVTSLGNKQQAHVYSPESGDCSAFLANYDTESAARVLFNNVHYNLPPWSISILPDCRNAVFNTAKVGVQTSQMEMLPTNTPNFKWQSYLEDLSSLDDSSTFTTQGLLEQINVTRDTSDYLWYMTSVDIGETESFLHGGELPTLIIQSTGHAVHIFVNGQLSGSAFGTRENRRFTYRGKISLHSGTNKIALLSVAVGLPNVGGHFESWNTGILGPVALHGLSQGKLDLSWQKWTYQVGLKGEAMNLAYPTNTPSIGWMDASLTVQKSQPLTWHKTYFDAPEGDEPLALDMENMGKGQIWVNGESIGRYWTAFATGDCDHCSYTGTYKQNKCLSGCGQPTQRYYHVPRSWLKPSQNLLVVFEELGGNPSAVSLVKRSVSGVCAEVSEYHPNIKNWQLESYGKGQTFHRPKVHLKCSPGQAISAIKFASFGTPLGKCGSYQQGECHAAASYAILERKCVGKARCAVTISNSNFGKDPCPNVLKRLTVEAVCSHETSVTSWRP